jgi:hypothetical protein
MRCAHRISVETPGGEGIIIIIIIIIITIIISEGRIFPDSH